MITIRPGSHVHTLLTVLSFVGEYPVTALGLLGSVRSYKDLIHKLTMPQEFRFPDSEERFTCRLLTVSGKGKRKTIRLHKGALPLLKHWDEDAYDNYMYEFDEHTFSGNSRHVERNHLVAETAVMCMKAGIEANPLYTPEVMDDEVRRLRLTEPCFYFARELKRVNDYELNKIRFTRLAGAIVYPGGAYAAYNYREEMLKWMGEGELKIKLHLQEIFYPMKSFEFPLREAAIIFGADYDVALNMLKEMKETQKLDNGLFHTYKDQSYKVEIGFTEHEYFCMRIPLLIPGKDDYSLRYLKNNLSAVLNRFFEYRQRMNSSQSIVVFRHVHDIKRSPWERVVPADAEVECVIKVLFQYVFRDAYAVDFRHYHCCATGEGERTEVYVVPLSEFGRWFIQETIIPEKGWKLYDSILEAKKTINKNTP